MKQLRFIAVFVVLIVIGVLGVYRTKYIKSESVSAQTPPECSTTDTANWCQVQRDAQRTGYTPESLGTNFSVAWTKAFQPEKVHPQVQAIICSQKVFVGTEMGSVYALDWKTGQQQWKKTFTDSTTLKPASIYASVACDGQRIYFGAMDGAVYAVNANSGTQIWKKQVILDRGFSTAPVFADNKIMLGGRDGIFYALDPVNGNILWQYDTGAPILQTAAYNNGRVFFGTMNMYVYALNSNNGTLAWKSIQLTASRGLNGQRLVGMALKDYWPVVHQGKVIVRPMGDGIITDLNAYNSNPNAYPKTLFVFDEVTGAETVVEHQDRPTMHGAVTPPCVDRDGNLIITTGGGGYGGPSTATGWGRLSLSTGTIVEEFITASKNVDENENVSCSNNLIFILHTIDISGLGVAGLSGYYNLDTSTWVNLGGGATSREMYNNTMGAGGNPASIAGGIVYHITTHELVARRTQ